jgi:hypothetical protein
MKNVPLWILIGWMEADWGGLLKLIIQLEETPRDKGLRVK